MTVRTASCLPCVLEHEQARTSRQCISSCILHSACADAGTRHALSHAQAHRRSSMLASVCVSVCACVLVIPPQQTAQHMLRHMLLTCTTLQGV
eukprot:4174147-Alexandrium_andersonii.AAC.1